MAIKRKTHLNLSGSHHTLDSDNAFVGGTLYITGALSASAGITAPVKIRTAAPLGKDIGALPAATVPTTEMVREVTSLQRNAYPSIADTSAEGLSNIATIGSASTRPSASSNSQDSVVVVRIKLRSSHIQASILSTIGSKFISSILTDPPGLRSGQSI